MTCATCQRLRERIEELEMLTYPDRRREADMRVLLNLTPNESTMLRALYEAHGRTLSYEFLIETRIRINAEDPANSRRAVSVLIHRLRKKLGMDIIGLARAEGYFLTPAGRSVVEQALRKLP